MEWKRLLREERFVFFAIVCLVVSIVCLAWDARALPGAAGWRDNFPSLHDLTELAVGDVVDVRCFEDEDHPDYDWKAWAPSWEQWEAQVVGIESPGVYRLNAFPDLMAGKTSFEEFWDDDAGGLYAGELPHLELKDFGETWPDIGPDVSQAYVRFVDGVWSIDSHTRIRHYGFCGSRQFDVMVGDHVEATWDAAAQRYEGTLTNHDVPSFCMSRRWQPYFCLAAEVRVRNYCAYLSERDGHWQDRMERLVWYNATPAITALFEGNLLKLESYCTTNQVPDPGGGAEATSSSGPVCSQAALPEEAPPTIAAQCEILQELIVYWINIPSEMATLAPQYQRLGCPCSEDDDASGVPDYFELTWPAEECPDVAMMAETSEHEAYLIPVAEPSKPVLLGVGLAIVALLWIIKRRSNG